LKKVLEDGDYGKWEFATHPWTILLDILGCLGKVIKLSFLQASLA
jgi:hypothetical protein